MAWLSLFNLALKFANLALQAMRDKNLIDGATAKVIATSLEETSDLMANAITARREANRINADPDRLHDDDGFKRE